MASFYIQSSRLVPLICDPNGIYKDVLVSATDLSQLLNSLSQPRCSNAR